jgi:hypothetical protein
MQVVKAESQKEPLILFIRNVEKSIIGNFERYMKLESLKENRLVVIGSHTLDQHKDKGHSISSISTKGGHNVTALLDLSFLVGLLCLLKHQWVFWYSFSLVSPLTFSV